jgi:hypothetical protein
VVKCRHKKKFHLNQKDSGKNNKEILKSQQLSNNKDNKEEHQIKLKDKKSPKELKNMKPNIKLHKNQKSKQEETLN